MSKFQTLVIRALVIIMHVQFWGNKGEVAPKEFQKWLKDVAAYEKEQSS